MLKRLKPNKQLPNPAFKYPKKQAVQAACTAGNRFG
jgi:hypothetical protein